MSEFQEMSSSAPPVPSASVPSTSEVHQFVFRWEGNQGRQVTGMKAVAHSTSPERADQLGRELGPLLWVSGPGAARPSVVRTLSRDGDVLLVRRWPTMDRTGRPSTISHVLMGAPGTLKTRQCLGLAYGGWGSRENAERATGQQPMVDCAHLDTYARQRLPRMRDRLDSVRHALILTTAEWLRDPAQRLSLLVEEEKLSGWPDQDEAPLVYLGLFLLFHDWPGHEWTFATYDTVDTHPLRLTSVPRWELDTGGSGPLARVMGHTTTNPRFEHQAAARLVEHLLAHREARPGVPQLTKELSAGATMDWDRRKDLLQQILKPDHRPTATPRPPAPQHQPPPQPPHQPQQQPPRHQQLQQQQLQQPYRATPYEEPRTAYANQHPQHHQPQPQAQPQPQPQPLHVDHQPHTDEQRHADRLLHEKLRGHERGIQVQHSTLVAQLQKASDDALLRELQSAELPPDSVELLLYELGKPWRVKSRPLEMRSALCTQILRNHLYLTPPPHAQGHAQTGESMSGTALASRAAHLFSWAVAPLAGDETHLTDLRELLYTMVRAPHPVWSSWLSQTLVSPPTGEAPDLPPTIWQQILRDALTRPTGPQPTVTLPPLPTTAPDAPATTPRTPPMSRLNELTSNAGCVIGACVTVIIVVLITIVAIAT
ncbi:hypothetical protein [Streptomyces graminilatus]|uniref:hypothetical protein n=1 Tax=Streptomyces graminilatus TaxID=1464070 RepID=UPI000B1FFAAD|nr:hypothetical protein [Streptomyces graminilatus]